MQYRYVLGKYADVNALVEWMYCSPNDLMEVAESDLGIMDREFYKINFFS